jgi:hypothetical protein
MNLRLVDEHLRRADQSVSPFDKFDAGWKAFTQLYQAERRPGQPNRDGDLIGRSAGRLGSHADRIVNRVILHPLISLDPIYDEKIFEESQQKDFSCFMAVKAIAPDLGSRSANVGDLNLLISLLYLIRCNLFKGYKLHDSVRDEKVLSAASPLLLAFTRALRLTHHEVIERQA